MMLVARSPFGKNWAPWKSTHVHQETFCRCSSRLRNWLMTMGSSEMGYYRLGVPRTQTHRSHTIP
eukprot:3351576-Rhodomonas_salina.1